MTTVESVLREVKAKAKPGNPESVLRAVDAYAERGHFLIHVGKTKRLKMEQLIRQADIGSILELGTNFGYSAILMARLLRMKNSLLVSIEISPGNARVARQMVEFAGLNHKIKIINGSADRMIPRLHGTFDLVFLDHEKDRYLPDLKLIERYGLIKDGSIILADNIGFYGHALRAFQDYVNTPGRYVSHTIRGDDGFENRIHDAMELSVFMGLK